MMSVPQSSSPDLLYDEMEGIQSRIHRWGFKNQVQFVPSKEHFKIMHLLLAWMMISDC